MEGNLTVHRDRVRRVGLDGKDQSVRIRMRIGVRVTDSVKGLVLEG